MYRIQPDPSWGDSTYSEDVSLARLRPYHTISVQPSTEEDLLPLHQDPEAEVILPYSTLDPSSSQADPSDPVDTHDEDDEGVPLFTIPEQFSRACSPEASEPDLPGVAPPLPNPDPAVDAVGKPEVSSPTNLAADHDQTLHVLPPTTPPVHVVPQPPTNKHSRILKRLEPLPPSPTGVPPSARDLRARHRQAVRQNK